MDRRQLRGHHLRQRPQRHLRLALSLHPAGPFRLALATTPVVGLSCQ